MDTTYLSTIRKRVSVAKKIETELHRRKKVWHEIWGEVDKTVMRTLFSSVHVKWNPSILDP